MLVVISPAKTLDYESRIPAVRATQPRMLDESEKLVSSLKKLSAKQVSDLMNISEKLGKLNADRFAAWSRPFTSDNARPCIFAFKGDVYTGLDAEKLDKSQLQQAQKQLRILSGLYGILRPLDLMQPYRLEMGTSFKNERGKNLYDWWGEQITRQLNKDLKAQGSDVLVNLASNEYFKSVKKKSLDARIVTPVFQDEKNGKYKVISFYAKKARGLMASWIITEQPASVEELKKFSVGGYRYYAAESTDDAPVFRRKEQ